MKRTRSSTLTDRRDWRPIFVGIMIPVQIGFLLLSVLFVKEFGFMRFATVIGSLMMVVGVLLLPRAKEYLVYLCVFLIPWFLLNKQFGPVNISLFDLVTVLLAVLYVGDKIIKGDLGFARNPFLPALWFLLFSAVLSVCVADDILLSLRIITLIMQGSIVYLFTIDTIKTKEQLKTLVLVFLASAFLPALLGVYEFRLGGNIGEWGGIVRNIGVYGLGMARVSGPFVTANSFGAFLYLVIPIGITTAFAIRRRIHFSVQVMLIFGLIAVLGMTFSRASWIAFFAAMIVVFFLSIRGRRAVLSLAMGIGVLFLLFMVARLFLPLPFLLRFVSIGAAFQDPAVNIRLNMWRAAIDVFRDYPLLGAGIGNFALVYAGRTVSWLGPGFANAHNIWFNVAAEMGLLGIVGLIWFLASSSRFVLRTYRQARDRFLKCLSLGLVGCAVAFWVGNLADLVWVTPTHELEVALIWFVWSLVVLTNRFAGLESRKTNGLSETAE